ncbi:MAG: S-layer homology domain-containing protein [Oscillospiraceae bacterium]|jgi:hypothetical protein|nr:S-layer homology domain-containing protein [Oscillospiraceae bacterium]
MAKKRLVSAAVLCAVIFSILNIPLINNANAKTTANGEYVETVLFYVTNKNGQEILFSQMPVTQFAEDAPSREVHNYSIIDSLKTTVHQEATGYTAHQFIEYAQGQSTISDLRSVELDFADDDTIAIWTLDKTEYGELNTFSWNTLYGVPRYNFPLLYRYWNYVTQDYYDPDEKMTRDEVIEHIFTNGEQESVLFSATAFSQRYNLTSEKWDAQDYNMEDYWTSKGLLDTLRTVRLMLPMSEAELRNKTPTAMDSRYWGFAIKLSMETAPEITPLGAVPPPTGYLTEDATNYYLNLTCADPNAQIYLNPFAQSANYMPARLHNPEDPYAIPKSSVINGVIEMTAHAVRDGYTDAGVVTLELTTGTKSPNVSAPGSYIVGSGDLALAVENSGNTAAWANQLSVTVNGSSAAFTFADGILSIDDAAFPSAGLYTIALASADYSPQTLYVNAYYAAPDIASVVSEFGSAAEIEFSDISYQSAASVKINSISVPATFLDRTVAGKITIKDSYFSYDGSVLTAAGEYTIKITNAAYWPQEKTINLTLYEPGSAIVTTVSAAGVPGAEIVVPVRISSNPGIAGFSLRVDYDESNLTLTSAVAGSMLSKYSDAMYSANLGTKLIAWARAVDVTDVSGELLVLTFAVKQNAPAKDYSVTLSLKNNSSAEFVNAQGASVPVRFISGTDAAVNVVWDGNIDVGWYNDTDTEFHISTPQEFAGLAAIVNGIYNKYSTGTTPTAVIGDEDGVKIWDFSASVSGETGEATSYHYGIDNFHNKTVYIDADLDMGGVYNERTQTWSGPNYMPIGGQYLMETDDLDTLIGSSFCGTLDAQGHTISNIYCERHTATFYKNSQSIGLIGRLGVHDNEYNTLGIDVFNPTVRNVIITGYISGNRSVGGIVGKMGKTAYNYYGATDGRVGGIIENCINYAHVKNTDAKGGGGIVGAGWNGGYVKNCINYGRVENKFSNASGGIVGSAEIKIINCVNIGKVTQASGTSAAIATQNGGAIVENSYWLAGSADAAAYNINSGIESKTMEELKSPAMLAALNRNNGDFKFDADGNLTLCFVGAVDKSALNVAITAAESEVAAVTYTKSSQKALQNAIDAADAVAADGYALQPAINAAAETVRAAIAALINTNGYVMTISADTVSVTQTGTVNVTLTLSGSATSAGWWNAEVSYDSDTLEYVSALSATGLTVDASIPGLVKLSAAAEGDNIDTSGNGTEVAALTFAVKAGAVADVAEIDIKAETLAANAYPAEGGDNNIARSEGGPIELNISYKYAITLPDEATGVTGVDADGRATKGVDVTFKLSGSYTVSYTVGGGEAAMVTPSGGVYRIRGAGITEDIVVTAVKVSSPSPGGGGGGGGGSPVESPTLSPSPDPAQTAEDAPAADVKWAVERIDTQPVTSAQVAEVVQKFADIQAGNWFAEAVAFSVENNLFQGVSDSEFAPQAQMTRAMLITVLARAAGIDESGGDKWYSKPVEWARSLGISDGSGLNDDVSREQIVTMLWRFAGEPQASGTGGISDSDSVSGWAYSAVSWALSEGIIQGYEDNTFRPGNSASRAEVAVLIQRFLA